MIISEAFCKQSLRQFQIVTDSLDDLIRVPRVILLEAQSIVDRFVNVVYREVAEQIGIIEDTFLDIITLNDIDQSESFQNICKDVFACKAFIHSLYDTGTLDVILDSTPYPDFDSYYDDFINYYDQFELNVCSLGLRQTIRNWIYDQLEPLILQLTNLDNYLLTEVRTICTSLITQYNNLLSDLGIYDLMKLLDEFENCALALCDVKSSANNYKTDYSLRYKIIKVSNAWQEGLEDWIEGETEPTRQSLLNQRNDLRTRIQNSRSGSLDDTSRQYVSKEETVQE